MSAIEKLKNAKFSRTVKVKMPKVSFSDTESKKVAAKKKGEFVKAFQKSAFDTEKQISYWLDEAVQEATWQWPRPTDRVSGEHVPKGARNIVDTGALMRSKKLKTQFTVTTAKITVTYGVPYAALVHWGGYVLNYGDPTKGQTYMKPRPWVQTVFSTRSDADMGQSDRFGFLDAIKEQMLLEFK